jgi:hypothetical protein
MTRPLNRAFVVLIGLTAVMSPSIAVAAAPSCAAPALTVDDGDASFAAAFSKGSPKLAQVEANFAAAYASACAKGLLKTDLPAITLLNAPNANQAGIGPDDRGRRVLEYPFLTEDGQTFIPAAEEIEEAIYCAVVGATEAEQEESGRCLPD